MAFSDALFKGLALDGGLFMPDRIPTLSPDELTALTGKPYSEVAYSVLHKYLQTEIDGDDLKKIVTAAYDFDIPIERLDEQTHIMRLDQGPTASFKDFGARFMARMMAHLRPDEQEVTVLVATSGDTGSAVGEAYHGLDGFCVFILYPRDEVSTIQKQQLDSIGDNVEAVAVDGKFDDCQRLGQDYQRIRTSGLQRQSRVGSRFGSQNGSSGINKGAVCRAGNTRHHGQSHRARCIRHYAGP